MKNFLSTYVLCLFLAGLLFMLCMSFGFRFWIVLGAAALPAALLASGWREHDERIQTLEKRIQDMEAHTIHIEEKENNR